MKTNEPYTNGINLPGDGTYKIEAWTTDGSNNSTHTTSGEYKIDTSDPTGLSITASNVTTTSVQITFSATDTVSGISQYLISRSTTSATDGFGNTKTYNVHPGGAITIDGLSDNTTYWFRLIAVNGAGGQATKVTDAIKTPIANRAPTIETASYYSKDTDRLAFKVKGNDADGDTLTYVLYTKPTTSSSWSEKARTTTTNANREQTMTATGLSMYTDYNWYVSISDGKANAVTSSTSASAKTMCSGTTSTCTSSEAITRYCTKCNSTNVESAWHNLNLTFTSLDTSQVISGSQCVAFQYISGTHSTRYVAHYRCDYSGCGSTEFTAVACSSACANWLTSKGPEYYGSCPNNGHCKDCNSWYKYDDGKRSTGKCTYHNLTVGHKYCSHNTNGVKHS